MTCMQQSWFQCDSILNNSILLVKKKPYLFRQNEKCTVQATGRKPSDLLFNLSTKKGKTTVIKKFKVSTYKFSSKSFNNDR